MGRKLKLMIEVFYYLFLKLSISKSNKKILIVKNDSIGDYVIFNAFITEIKNSNKYKNYSVHLLTNNKLKTIALDLNSNVLDKIIVLDNSHCFENIANFISFFWSLKKEKYECVMHPTYSPNWETLRVIKYTSAKYKIGYDGDLSNINQAYKEKYKNVYTTTLTSKLNLPHEFERNYEFFSTVLGGNLKLTKPEIYTNLKNSVESNIVLICPGAQYAFRIWSLANFAEVIIKLNTEQPHLKFIIVTGPNEDNLFYGIKEHCALFVEHFKISSMKNLVELIIKSKFIICNDSSSAHIAVACDKQIVCVTNANHYKRFIPYPENMLVKQQVVLPPLFLKLTNDEKMSYYMGSEIDINTISVNSVLESCKQFL